MRGCWLPLTRQFFAIRTDSLLKKCILQRVSRYATLMLDQLALQPLQYSNKAVAELCCIVSIVNMGSPSPTHVISRRRSEQAGLLHVLVFDIVATGGVISSAMYWYKSSISFNSPQTTRLPQPLVLKHCVRKGYLPDPLASP
jgi:hypothetical protein